MTRYYNISRNIGNNVLMNNNAVYTEKKEIFAAF